MKKSLTRLGAVLLSVTLLAGFAGCSKNEDEEVKPTEREEIPATDTEDTEEGKEGLARSYLTGEWIDEELASRKPVAIMIGNTNDALPQYGLSQADVMYEAPAEGGITRLMPIFQDYSNLERIGSVRSCRHYYAYYAMEFEAMYIHYGQAAYATDLLNSGKVEDINGLVGSVDAAAFFRDKSRKAPHNAFVSTEGIDAGIDLLEYDRKLPEDYKGHYVFNTDDEKEIELTGDEAVVVQPGYYINNPWFVYNDEDGLYYRFQFKKEHMDENTGTQLSFKNIILQYCDYTKIDAQYGYLDVESTGEGTGKYITNGKVIDVTWSKADENSPTRYFDTEGNEIVLNQGKTMVCVLLNDMESRLNIFANEGDFTPPTPTQQ